MGGDCIMCTLKVIAVPFVVRIQKAYPFGLGGNNPCISRCVSSRTWSVSENKSYSVVSKNRDRLVGIICAGVEDQNELKVTKGLLNN